MIPILQIVFAFAMLLLGRKLFWVFVGSVGFVVATELAIAYFSNQPGWLMILVGLAVGLIGALLALFFQTGAIAFAGILGGGYLGMLVIQYLSITNPAIRFASLLIGAFLGLAALIVVFDYGLIAISSLTGSLVITEMIGLAGFKFWILVVAITLLGSSIQLKQFQNEELAA